MALLAHFADVSVAIKNVNMISVMCLIKLQATVALCAGVELEFLPLGTKAE